MEQYYEAIDLLKGMISRPSFSREETAVADYLQKCWSDAGHHLFRKGNNLWIIAPGFDFAKPTLLLNSHIDTVKPAAGWQKDPFLPEETEDDRLYGLGSKMRYMHSVFHLFVLAGSILHFVCIFCYII